MQVTSMEEKKHSKSKFNIAWISVLVIFIGTIIYPMMLERATRHAKRHSYTINIEQPQTVPVVPVVTEPVAEPVVTEPVTPAFIFTKNLQLGDKSPDVKKLQEYLNSRGFLIAESGPGSPGQESELFGKGTKAALIKFQETYSDILLKPYGLTTGTGFFGEATRNFVNS